MAKWGEGDPRWIVEERPDATNVNNWHWTEKNADQWSKKKLEELFKGLVITDEAQQIEVWLQKRVLSNQWAVICFFVVITSSNKL